MSFSRSPLTISVALLVGLVLSGPAEGMRRGAGNSRPSAGTVCVAPVARPTAGTKSLRNPTGGNRVSAYSIRIDDAPAVAASDEKGLKLSGLSVSKRHLVKIYGDGKLLHSFRFKFADYSSNDLCLWFNSLYETWSLWEAKDAGAKCSCGGKTRR